MIDVPIGEQLGLYDHSDGYEPLPNEYETIVLGRVRIGNNLTIDGQAVEIVSARPVTVRDFDPPLYGDHLLGHEGEIGTIVWYQPVSVEEGE